MEIEKIKDYLQKNNVKNKEILEAFLENSNEFYLRTNLYGHITGSAFILNENMDNALLILHGKYNTWCGPGGHVDENETAKIACKRESEEEVGLHDLNYIIDDIFDIDIHKIAAKKKNNIMEPEHWHFDVRYLLKSKKNELVRINKDEINDFKFIPLSDLKNDLDPSISRQALKALMIVNDINFKKNKKIYVKN